MYAINLDSAKIGFMKVYVSVYELEKRKTYCLWNNTI